MERKRSRWVQPPTWVPRKGKFGAGLRAPLAPRGEDDTFVPPSLGAEAKLRRREAPTGQLRVQPRARAARDQLVAPSLCAEAICPQLAHPCPRLAHPFSSAGLHNGGGDVHVCLSKATKPLMLCKHRQAVQQFGSDAAYVELAWGIPPGRGLRSARQPPLQTPVASPEPASDRAAPK